MKQLSLPWICLIAVTTLRFAPAALAQDEWPRNFRAGLLLGGNIKADFKTSGTFSLSGNLAGDPTAHKTDHIYDDGYVRVDNGGNADGNTWFWGYDSTSQYNSAANTLIFHSSQSVDIANAVSTGHDDSPYIGLDLAYGGTFRRSGKMHTGWEVGFGLLPIFIKDTRDLSGTFTRTAHRYSTVVDDTAIVVPGEGYHGTSEGPGPLIPDTGTSIGNQSVPGTLTGSRTLDVQLFTLRFGPTFYWSLHPRWAVSASAGGVVGLVTGDYSYDEMASFASGTTHASGKFGKTEATYGGYINALALFHVEEHADLFAGVQFMPMTDVHFSKDGREAKLDMGSAFYFMAGINWPF